MANSGEPTFGGRGFRRTHNKFNGVAPTFFPTHNCTHRCKARRSWWRGAKRRNPTRFLFLATLVVALLIATLVRVLLPERAGGITCDTLAGSFKIRCVR